MTKPTNPDQKDSLFTFPSEEQEQAFKDQVLQNWLDKNLGSDAKTSAKPTPPSSLLGPDDPSS